MPGLVEDDVAGEAHDGLFPEGAEHGPHGGDKDDQRKRQQEPRGQDKEPFAAFDPGQFEVTFKNLYEGEGAGYIFLEGELEIRKDGKLIGIAAPQRRVYAKWGQMQFAEAAVIPSLGNEFYATLMAVDQQNRAVFRLSSNPLVNWLWIGGILMCLLPFVSFRRRNGREN